MAAATLSFQGTFATDDRIQLFNFSLGTTGVVTIQSFGYGGGTNSAGTMVPAGGFDTLFTIFMSDGTMPIPQDDDPLCSHSQSHNGACLDSYFNGSLTAGSYILALTESGNNSNGDLSDGFSQQGVGNFTCTNGNAFCDLFGNQNNGNWAVDFVSVDSAAPASAPEPMTLPLTAAGVAMFALASRFRRTQLNRIRS